MHFMNIYEIEDAVQRFEGHPTLGPATRTLRSLAYAASDHSDGWAYYPAPARAAQSLMALIPGRYDDPRAVTAAQVRKAYGPIRGFLTRKQWTPYVTVAMPVERLDALR